MQAQQRLQARELAEAGVGVPAHAQRASPGLYKGHLRQPEVVKTGLKIFLANDADHEKVKNYFLTSHKTDTPVSFYTFAPRGSKPNKKFLILGLDEDHPLGSIKTTLDHPDLIDVRRLTASVDGKQVDTPNVLVTFSPNYKYEQHLKLIRSIDHVMVRHKPFVANQGTPTCQRCLTVGHTKRYCWRPQRCVRCSGNHPVSECNPDTPTKCSNCGGPHPASFRQCPHRQRIISSKAQAKKPAPVPKHPPPPPPSVWTIPPQPIPGPSGHYPAPGHYPALPTQVSYPAQPAPTQPQPPVPQPQIQEPDTPPRWVQHLTKEIKRMIETILNSLVEKVKEILTCNLLGVK